MALMSHMRHFLGGRAILAKSHCPSLKVECKSDQLELRSDQEGYIQLLEATEYDQVTWSAILSESPRRSRKFHVIFFWHYVQYLRLLIAFR
jgi:hypothetical protein